MIIDLMADDLWSDVDITNRTESIIRMEFSVMEEQILNRKVTGQAMGLYQLTQEEQASLNRYIQICEVARLEGIKAREDMVLLRKILAVEKANRRLALPAVEPILDVSGTITNEIELELDRMERMEANTVINTASSETIEWVTRRAMSKDSLTDIVVN